MTSENELDAMRQLFRAVAPVDLADRPLYFANVADLPAAFRSIGSLAYTGPRLDLALSGWLQDQGQWSGRGSAIVFGCPDLALQAELDAGGDDAFATDLFRSRLFATGLHELGHLLAEPANLSAPPKLDEASRAAAAVIHRWAKDDWTPPPEPWHGHAADWLRLLCHVVFRAEKVLGRRLPSYWLADHETYALSPIGCYEFALDDEPERLAAESFETIRRTAPPEEFVKLWHRDVWNWYAGLTEPSAEATRVVASQLAALFTRS